jgi:hypothetical protein
MTGTTTFIGEHEAVLAVIRTKGIAFARELEEALPGLDLRPVLADLISRGVIVQVGGRKSRPMYRLA